MDVRSFSMRFRIRWAIVGAALCMGPVWALAQTAENTPAARNPQATSNTIDLPSSKQLIGEAPGHPQRINSLPISMAVSPDGRYVVTVNAGYGTFESNYEQSFSVLD